MMEIEVIQWLIDRDARDLERRAYFDYQLTMTEFERAVLGVSRADYEGRNRLAHLLNQGEE